MTAIIISVLCPLLCLSYQTMGEDTQIVLETSSQGPPRAPHTPVHYKRHLPFVPGQRLLCMPQHPTHRPLALILCAHIHNPNCAFLASLSG